MFRIALSLFGLLGSIKGKRDLGSQFGERSSEACWLRFGLSIGEWLCLGLSIRRCCVLGSRLESGCDLDSQFSESGSGGRVGCGVALLGCWLCSSERERAMRPGVLKKEEL